jgi:hypothetical protein
VKRFINPESSLVPAIHPSGVEINRSSLMNMFVSSTIAGDAPAKATDAGGAAAEALHPGSPGPVPYPALSEFRAQYEDIFGKVPPGITLENQLIEMLCHWHRKAIEAISQAATGIDDETFDHYCGIKNRILGAILSAPASTAAQVAAKLRAVLAEIDCLKTDSIEDGPGHSGHRQAHN